MGSRRKIFTTRRPPVDAIQSVQAATRIEALSRRRRTNDSDPLRDTEWTKRYIRAAGDYTAGFSEQAENEVRRIAKEVHDADAYFEPPTARESNLKADSYDHLRAAYDREFRSLQLKKKGKKSKKRKKTGW